MVSKLGISSVKFSSCVWEIVSIITGRQESGGEGSGTQPRVSGACVSSPAWYVLFSLPLSAYPREVVYKIPRSSEPEHTLARILALLLASHRTSVSDQSSPSLSSPICNMGQPYVLPRRR